MIYGVCLSTAINMQNWILNLGKYRSLKAKGY